MYENVSNNKALDRVAEKLRNGHLVLWAGAGLSKYAGYPLGSELVQTIKESMSPTEGKECKDINSLPEIAQAFIDNRNGTRNDLMEVLLKRFSEPPKDIIYHRYLTEMPLLKIIITTNFDELFESVFKEHLSVIYQNTQIPFPPCKENIELYKIHGNLKSPETIIITKSDYNTFYGEKLNHPIWVQIKAIISRCSVLFLGYSLDDPHVQFLFDENRHFFGNLTNEHFFIAPKQPSYKVKALIKNSITYVDQTAEDAITFLHRRIKVTLIEDIIDGKVDSSLASKLLKERGISSGLQLNDNGKINKMTFKGKDAKAGLRFDLSNSFYQENIDFFIGKRFGKLKIPDSEIRNLNANINNLPLPFGNQEHAELIITSLPNKKVTVNFLLKKANLVLENVQSLAYFSAHCFEVHCEHELFKIQFSIDKSNFQGGKVCADFAIQMKPIMNAIKSLKVYEFMYQWFKGDTLLIDNYKENKLVPFPFHIDKIQRQALLKSFKFHYKFYQYLIVVEKYVGRSFAVPDTITTQDFDSLYFLSNVIKKKKTELPNGKLTVHLLNDGKQFDIVKKNELLAIRLGLAGDLIIKLFHNELHCKFEFIQIDDAYIINRTEFLEKLDSMEKELSVTFGSRSDKVILKLNAIQIK